MRYWTVPDDGAPLRCMDCQELGSHDVMLFIELSSGKRMMLHKECVDEDWLARATYMGEFQLP